MKLFSVWVWFYYSVLFLVFFCIIFVVYLLTFLFDKYQKIPNRILAMMAWFMMKASSGWQIEKTGLENFNAEVPTIFIGNHQSFLDMALVYQLPWQMKWVSKRSLSLIPIMGWMVFLTGHLTINRSSKSALKKLSNLVKPLKDKVPVMIFPEGTRSIDGNVKTFKNGAFLLALEYGFNIQPIVVDGGNDALKSGSGIVNPNVNFKISVLEPIHSTSFKDLNTLKSHCFELISEELSRIRSSEIT